MDINCISNCIYQNDGKCTLTELPRNFTALRQEAASGNVETADGDLQCPYFVRS